MKPIVPLLVLLALTFPATAGHCTTWTTTRADVDTNPLGVEGVPRYYVESDNYCLNCIGFYTLWVYEESNGIDGLQRADEVVDDTCHDMIPGDTIIV